MDAMVGPAHAPEFQILGTAGLAPASDLVGLVDRVSFSGSPVAGVVSSYMVKAYTDNYPNVTKADLVPTSARTMVREIAARCAPTGVTGARPDAMVSILSLVAVSGDRPVFNFDLATSPFANRLRQNVSSGPFTQPLFISWGTSDEVIHLSVQEGYVKALCSTGQAFEYRSYSDMSHMSVLEAPSALPADLEQWTKDRLQGQPTRNSCAGLEYLPSDHEFDRQSFSARGVRLLLVRGPEFKLDLRYSGSNDERATKMDGVEGAKGMAEEQAFRSRVGVFGHRYDLILVAPVCAEQPPQTVPIGVPYRLIAQLAGKRGRDFYRRNAGDQQGVAVGRCADRANTRRAWLRAIVAAYERRSVEENCRHQRLERSWRTASDSPSSPGRRSSQAST
jgi:hypothetical protein